MVEQLKQLVSIQKNCNSFLYDDHTIKNRGDGVGSRTRRDREKKQTDRTKNEEEENDTEWFLTVKNNKTKKWRRSTSDVMFELHAYNNNKITTRTENKQLDKKLSYPDDGNYY